MTRSSVTMFSDPGDYIGGGQPRWFDSDNAAISVQGSAAYLTVRVSGGNKGDYYDMNFAAPPGEALTPGVYDQAQRASFRTATRPGIDIYGDGRGCNEVTGRFEVRDLAVNSDGVPTRLWIVYEHHCEGGQPALFGEVRVGEPTAGTSAFEPTVVRWPAADLGQSATAVPVTVAATAPTTVTGAATRGDDSADFPIRVDDCTGRRLLPGASCQVWVRFVPTSAGSRSGVLRITFADGSHQAIALQGFAYGGRTRVTLNSQPGDWVGGGSKYTYDPGNARITASGSRQHVRFSVNAADGSWWSSDLAPGGGDLLAPGRYEATRYPFNGSGAGLDVSGNGRGCNTLTGSFTVTEAAFYPDGTLRRFGASFEQHCEGAAPALTGTLEFRAGDTTTPAPWMTSGPLTTLPADDDAIRVPVNASPPSISGSAVQGQTLTEGHGAWSNTPTLYGYQWRRCDSAGANCVAILGAVGQTYTLTAADVGSTIRVQETASNGDGPGGAGVSSAQTALVTGVPVSLSPPVISGSAVQGQTLTETHGTWSNNPTGYSYQWRRCDSGGANCAAISGAVGQTYTLTAADHGSTIRVQETASNAVGAGDAASSAQTALVAGVPANTSPPSISGSAVQGQTLTEAHGSWSNDPTGYSYQWRRCDSAGANCVAIAGAVGQSYTLIATDVGSTIRVQETASNADGPGLGASSAQTGLVTGVPVNVSPPSISGPAVEGQTLTEGHGSWSNNPAGYTYVWRRCDGAGANCVAIAGAVAQSYTLTAVDVGSTMRVQETASNSVGPSNPSSSSQTALVTGAPVNASPPSSSGPATQGQTQSNGGSSSDATHGPDTLAPGAWAYGVTNAVFVVGGGPTPTFASAAAKHKQGTTFAYTLSEPAMVRIAIGQRVAGRRRGKNCVAPTKKLTRKKTCTRAVVKGTLTRLSHKGANTVAFSGRLGSQTLAPGRYQATLTATDSAGNTSKGQTVTFTIVRL